MAPQGEIPVAASVLGTIGTICWCIQLVPQIWTNWRRKKTEGLPALMLFLWAIAAIPTGIYAIVQKFNIPIQLQPQIFCTLCLICWGQTLYYGSGWRLWTTSLLVVLTGVAFGGVEVLFILVLRGPYKRGVEWPVTTVGVVAAVILAVGLIPPYFELWKRGGRVIGINFIFLTVDFAGASFSLLALIAQQTFDVLGGTLYIVCLILETGIFLSQAIWLYRTRKVRREAKQAGKSYDDYVFEHDSQPTTAVHSANSSLETLTPQRHGSNGADVDLEKGENATTPTGDQAPAAAEKAGRIAH